MRNTSILMTAGLLLTMSSTAHALAWEEGGYCGNDPATPGVVYNFIKHFDYEQYYWASEPMFTLANNGFVDSVDFAYYCGHGNQYLIGVYSNGAGSGASTYINLGNVGWSSNGGYGDNDTEFIVFHSCQTIPSSLERSDWWSPWQSSTGIFDGLHQALGFRTNAVISTADDISNYFGARMAGNNLVWQSWFDAINAEGYHTGFWWWEKLAEFGSAVMTPGVQNDRYKYSHAPDEPNPSYLVNWYQY
ncbi:MAG: DUF6345 domain-containing protein [Candidatus Electrothrix sp. YB6]